MNFPPFFQFLTVHSSRKEPKYALHQHGVLRRPKTDPSVVQVQNIVKHWCLFVFVFITLLYII